MLKFGPETNGSELPAHVEGTVQAIVELYAEHRKEASAIEHAIDYATSVIARPLFLGALVLFVTVWIGINLILPSIGARAIDPPPFDGLFGFITLVSLFTATLILISQKRADRLASRREQMTLQVSILGEQKAAKTIALLEELRRDLPNVANRIDAEAKEMAKPANAHAVLNVIQEAHGEAAVDQDMKGQD